MSKNGRVKKRVRHEVCLVSARHFKNVPGRKTDVSDCRWLQHLHAVGLLRGSFRPEQVICATRTLLRHRQNLVEMASVHVLHMQKSMEQMNLKLQHVIRRYHGSERTSDHSGRRTGSQDTGRFAPWDDPGQRGDHRQVAGGELPR